MTYEKVDPGHAPAATEEPVDRACSCTCVCSCTCGASDSVAKHDRADGGNNLSDLQEEAITPG